MKSHRHSFEHSEGTLVFSSDGHITQLSGDSLLPASDAI